MTLLAQQPGLSGSVPTVDWSLLTPLLILVVGALVLLVGVAMTPRRPSLAVQTAVAVAAAGGALAESARLWGRIQDLPESAQPGLPVVGRALVVDGFSVFVTMLICATVVLVVLTTHAFARREGLAGTELHALVLLSASGGVIMASANDLIVLFLGLETLSLAAFVLAGFDRRRAGSLESAMKYFVLGAFSSAFLLYGIALTYGATGSTNLSEIGTFLTENVLTEAGLLLGGFALMLVGLGFKVAAVPFHAWTPDVYQGAPTPVTAFFASAVKTAGFAALLRVFFVTFLPFRFDWQPAIWALAVLTLLVGAVLAIVQDDVKRMLAYSSVNHAGYVLIGVQAATFLGVQAALFYLLAYTFMVLGTFGVVALVARRGDVGHTLDDYRGLARRRPTLAFLLTVFLLAQAGVPLTSGFLAKFYVISAAVEAGSYALAVIGMLAAAIAAFLYLRIVVAMYVTEEGESVEARPVAEARIPLAAGVPLVVTLAVTVAVGVAPGFVVDLARDAVPVLPL